MTRRMFHLGQNIQAFRFHALADQGADPPITQKFSEKLLQIPFFKEFAPHPIRMTAQANPPASAVTATRADPASLARFARGSISSEM